jgi:hypothetical protein
VFTPKARTGSGLILDFSESFKELAGKNGYTVTATLEKFMASAVELGLVFPSSKAKAC